MRKSSLKVSPVGKHIRSEIWEFTMAIEVPSKSQSLWGLVRKVQRLYFQTNFGLMKQCEDPESIRVWRYAESGNIGEVKFMYRESAGAEIADAPRRNSYVTQAASEQPSSCVGLKGLLMSFLLPSQKLPVWKYLPCKPCPSSSRWSLDSPSQHVWYLCRPGINYYQSAVGAPLGLTSHLC